MGCIHHSGFKEKIKLPYGKISFSPLFATIIFSLKPSHTWCNQEISTTYSYLLFFKYYNWNFFWIITQNPTHPGLSPENQFPRQTLISEKIPSSPSASTRALIPNGLGASGFALKHIWIQPLHLLLKGKVLAAEVEKSRCDLSPLRKILTTLGYGKFLHAHFPRLA